MSRLLTVFAGLSFCAFAQQSTLLVFSPDGMPPVPALMEAVRSEVARVIAPLNVRVRWQETLAPGDDLGQPIVLTFRESCSMAGYHPVRAAQSKEVPVLASTAVVNGQILPFVKVECGRIRDRVGPLLVGMDPAGQHAALGKAIGRVVAHEIYHVLSGSMRHAGSGVAVSCVTARDLLAERFDLDRWSVARVQEAYKTQVRPEPLYTGESEAEYTGR